ncbi:threonine aldolase family protein [Frateuria defendens]|uniref:threonine aldolase family protein n=1 Tax=Frateuria defendens TaxID=2219559 RepID=UPI00066FE12C|nr:beta-eliminating lyase-related protein [Frateuria defendens]
MVSRREFIRSIPLASLSLSAAGFPLRLAHAADSPTSDPAAFDRLVALIGDNVPVRIGHYPVELGKLLAAQTDVGDFYLAEGAVERLEAQFAGRVGKQAAVFFPTGTMANQVAIRLLCGERRHLLLQQESHVYRDESDAVSILSGINPVPLEGGVTDDLYRAVAEAFQQTTEDAYPVEIGAISLESPVRRLDGAALPLDTVRKISALARQNGAGMHLDGARLLLMSDGAGFDLRRYGACFDTVYVSLYKYLGAPFGALLAGDASFAAKARDLRHILGGTIFHGWMAALIASASLDGFEARFARARQAGTALLDLLDKVPGIEVRRVPHGTNIAFLKLDGRVQQGLAARLKEAGIVIGPIQHGELQITINETLLRRPVAAIAEVFAGTGAAARRA